MEELPDSHGHLIRLTEESWAVIIAKHPYMGEMRYAIGQTLQFPQEIRKSISDPETVRLYYRWFAETVVGAKNICVVVKFSDGDAFIITAYVTYRIKQGEVL